MDDFTYMRILLKQFGPDLSRLAEIDELFDEIIVNINPAIENTVTELMLTNDTYYEEIALQAFISGFNLAERINAELEYHLDN